MCFMPASPEKGRQVDYIAINNVDSFSETGCRETNMARALQNAASMRFDQKMLNALHKNQKIVASSNKKRRKIPHPRGLYLMPAVTHMGGCWGLQ